MNSHFVFYSKKLSNYSVLMSKLEQLFLNSLELSLEFYVHGSEFSLESFDKFLLNAAQVFASRSENSAFTLRAVELNLATLEKEPLKDFRVTLLDWFEKTFTLAENSLEHSEKTKAAFLYLTRNFASFSLTSTLINYSHNMLYDVGEIPTKSPFIELDLSLNDADEAAIVFFGLGRFIKTAQKKIDQFCQLKYNAKPVRKDLVEHIQGVCCLLIKFSLNHSVISQNGTIISLYFLMAQAAFILENKEWEPTCVDYLRKATDLKHSDPTIHLQLNAASFAHNVGAALYLKQDNEKAVEFFQLAGALTHGVKDGNLPLEKLGSRCYAHCKCLASLNRHEDVMDRIQQTVAMYDIGQWVLVKSLPVLSGMLGLFAVAQIKLGFKKYQSITQVFHSAPNFNVLQIELNSLTKSVGGLDLQLDLIEQMLIYCRDSLSKTRCDLLIEKIRILRAKGMYNESAEACESILRNIDSIDPELVSFKAIVMCEMGISLNQAGKYNPAVFTTALNLWTEMLGDIPPYKNSQKSKFSSPISDWDSLNKFFRTFSLMKITLRII